MEVGECSAVSHDDEDSTSFTNDEDGITVVCDDSVDASATATICMVQAVPDSYTVTSVAHSVDEDGNVHFIAAADGTHVSPTELQFVESSVGSCGRHTPDNGSPGRVAPLKTTHIVIHKQGINDALSGGRGIKTPTTPIAPPTPSTPRGRERGFRYQWDPSALEPVLPVRCKGCSGEFHKSRFGSGGRGRCIRMHDAWYTPSEFEAISGRSSSKDWKRSIHYAGRTLQCLIEDNILQPHATSCTCAACCDDDSVTGPVRLFVPYKRRKRDGSCSENPIRKKISVLKQLKSEQNSVADIKGDETTAVLVSFSNGLTQPVRIGDTINANDSSVVQILPDAEVGAIALADQLILTSTQPVATAKVTNGFVSSLIDASSAESPEQKIWDQLEEMANNLMQQVEQLKLLIEQARHSSNQDAIVQVLRAEFEKEKNDAVNAVRIEAQMQLARTIVEERQMKEIAMQQALAQARAELQEKLVGSIVEDKTTYTVWSSVPTVTDHHGIDELMEVGSSELVQEHDDDGVVEK